MSDGLPFSGQTAWILFICTCIGGLLVLGLVVGGKEQARPDSPLNYLLGERVGDCAEDEWRTLLWRHREAVQRNAGEAGRMLAEDGCSRAQSDRLIDWFAGSLRGMAAVEAYSATVMAPTTEGNAVIATLTPLLDAFNAPGAMDASTFRRMCTEAWAGRDTLLEALPGVREIGYTEVVARYEAMLDDLEHPLVECANSGQFRAP